MKTILRSSETKRLLCRRNLSIVFAQPRIVRFPVSLSTPSHRAPLFQCWAVVPQNCEHQIKKTKTNQHLATLKLGDAGGRSGQVTPRIEHSEAARKLYLSFVDRGTVFQTFGENLRAGTPQNLSFFPSPLLSFSPRTPGLISSRGVVLGCRRGL